MWTLAFRWPSHLSQVPTHIVVHLIPSISSAQNKVWWTYHWFGVCCYLFISLLRDIFLYAPSLWNCYNSHGEPALNKSLAKAIPASEHNLAQKQNKPFVVTVHFKSGMRPPGRQNLTSILGGQSKGEHKMCPQWEWAPFRGWVWVGQVPWTACVLL